MSESHSIRTLNWSERSDNTADDSIQELSGSKSHYRLDTRRRSFLAAMALTLFLVGLIIAVIIRMASIRARRVTVFSLFGFSSTEFSIALFLLAITSSARVLVGIGSLVANATEIRFSAGIYGELYLVLI